MMGTSFLFVVLSLVLQYSPASNTASTFVTMGTIFALTAYILQPIIYIRLKFRLPGLPRPFNMKLSGVIVAAVNIVIAIGALIGRFVVTRLCNVV
ncbi:hypothetical protein BC830DRAFT_716101 [Chytriomyces sp. MP71]|nr:hypothetical protein BC830DRAFT_716101 [Chytriomyces sp. MP71]